jgi:hypothetical protein
VELLVAVKLATSRFTTIHDVGDSILAAYGSFSLNVKNRAIKNNLIDYQSEQIHAVIPESCQKEILRFAQNLYVLKLNHRIPEDCLSEEVARTTGAIDAFKFQRNC